jgi:hypothetical protein
MVQAAKRTAACVAYVVIATWASAVAAPHDAVWFAFFAVTAAAAGWVIGSPWALALPLVVVAAGPVLALHEPAGTGAFVELSALVGMGAALLLRPVAVGIIGRHERRARARAWRA